MHTSSDYINKQAPKLWVIHNSDFSGECYVRWTIAGKNKEFTYEWKVDGQELLTGDFVGSQLYTVYEENNPVGDVPAWVIGRAVGLVVRTMMSRRIIGFVESL